MSDLEAEKAGRQASLAELMGAAKFPMPRPLGLSPLPPLPEVEESSLMHSAFSYEFVEPAISELRATGLLTAASDLEDLINYLPHKWQLKCPEQPPHDRQWREDMREMRIAWESKHKN